jgi:hypothetical protein
LFLAFYSLSAKEDLESFLSAKSLPAETESLGRPWTFRRIDLLFGPGPKAPKVMKNLGLDMSFNRRWIQQAFRQHPLCKIIWEPNFAKVR